MTPLWLNQSMNPPLHWLSFCQISNFLTDLALSMSKWPEKKRIWPASFYYGSESLKPSQICTGISVKRAISENCFDHSEAKWSPINEFLTFSGHLDTGLAAWSKKFEICHSLSLEGGGPKPRNQPIHTPHFGELYAWSRALMAISVTQYGYWLFICSRLNHQ